MLINKQIHTLSKLILTFVGMSFAFSSCDTIEEGTEEDFNTTGKGVLILCEGNYNSGNSSLSYYDSDSKQVENGVFQRANDRKLGDTGQSILMTDEGVAYIAMENSGIVWKIDAKTFRVQGELKTGDTEHMINPRYVHLVNQEKAYITDLYSPFITVFNPKTMQYVRSISTGQPLSNGYASTEEMVQIDNEVFTNCWSYSRNILIIDTDKDLVTDSIVLGSWQPKSMAVDANKKLWVITDGGYNAGGESFSDDVPHLYRIDPKSRAIELDMSLSTDESMVQIAMNPDGNILYILNNDIYAMDVNESVIPTLPLIYAPLDDNGTRHKLYGLDVNPMTGEIYVADAVDYRQAGVVYRYSRGGVLLDDFRVGLLPNHFAFTDSGIEVPEMKEEEEKTDKLELELVDKVFEYMPAPGHQVNGYTVVGDFIHDGATMLEACDTAMSHFRHTWSVSLGGQGGYIVAGFKNNVTNTGFNGELGSGDYELAIKGNPYSYQSEPGIIWVSMDENGDGLPNDPWYELAGSEYGTANETLDYAITYYKPTTPKSDIRWTDNQGGEGIIPYMDAWNKHDSYFQDWIPTEKDSEGREYHTYYGSRLKDTHTYENGMSMMYPFAWGYADNDGDDYRRNPEINFNGALGYFKISNAVTHDGKPANLPHINFIKIQTGQTGWTPNLGEISTEVYGIWSIKR